MKKIPIYILIITFVGFVVIGGLYNSYREYRKNQLAKNAPKAAEQIKVTLIEGWNNSEIEDELTKKGLIKKEVFNQTLKNFSLSTFPIITAAKPKNFNLEGFLFPDTYLFAKGSTDEEIITKILQNFEKRIKSLGIETTKKYQQIPGYENLVLDQNDSSGLTLFQVLTLASIVEKESGGEGISNTELNEQRATIAGIFFNRLKKGQALQSDATVNYVTGKTNASASLADTQINSPYNTYKYPGLTPGPICNPSLASIKAVLNPKKTDYYYFLHLQPSGKVLYSKTFEEHVSKKQ